MGNACSLAVCSCGHSMRDSTRLEVGKGRVGTESVRTIKLAVNLARAPGLVYSPSASLSPLMSDLEHSHLFGGCELSS